MRTLGLIVIGGALIASIASCKKEQKEVIATGIEGAWELRFTSSGMMPPTSYPAGNGTLISFDGTNYKHTRNGQVVVQGVYTLANDSTIDVRTCAKVPAKSSDPNTIIYDGTSNGYRNYFEISGSTLTITSGCTPLDGGTSIYKKIAEDAD